MLSDGAAREGDWLVALEQTAGRGRQGRSWVGLSGNFAGSTLIELHPGDPPPQSLSLAAGLALVEAVDAAAPGLPLLLKWPNDLLLDGAKLAGILLERSGDKVVAGFGVNLAAAPEVGERQTAHLAAAIAPTAFAPLLAGSFARVLASWRSSAPDLFARAWLERAHALGTPIAVHSEQGERLSGLFGGLGADGSLILRLRDGSSRTIHAGDVTLG